MSENGMPTTQDFHIGQFAKGRVAVFIDAANLHYSLLSLGWSLDYAALAEYLRSELYVVELRFYTAFVKEIAGQVDFLNKLEHFGFTVIRKEVKKYSKTSEGARMKGSLDVELALDAFELSPTYDVLVLFSGDSDFAPLLVKLRKRSISTLVVSTKRHVSLELLQRAKYINLKKFREVAERQDGRRTP